MTDHANRAPLDICEREIYPTLRPSSQKLGFNVSRLEAAVRSRPDDESLSPPL